jgi:hypothetical protein
VSFSALPFAAAIDFHQCFLHTEHRGFSVQYPGIEAFSARCTYLKTHTRDEIRA